MNATVRRVQLRKLTQFSVTVVITENPAFLVSLMCSALISHGETLLQHQENQQLIGIPEHNYLDFRKTLTYYTLNKVRLNKIGLFLFSFHRHLNQ